MTDGNDGVVAVITGAAAGIGQACALRLARDGAAVALLDVADASETEARIAESGGRAIAMRCDVTDRKSVAAAAQTVSAELGAPTILANVAGIYPMAPFADVTFEDWRRVLAVNLDGSFLTCQAFAPGMVAAGHGRIVNVSSGVVSTNATGQVPYIASKMGVIGLTRSLANDLGEANVTVNAIAPGIIHTQRVIEMAEGTPLFEIVEARQAIKRAGATEDIAGAVAFLASDAAAFITGQTLVADGGIMRV